MVVSRRDFRAVMSELHLKRWEVEGIGRSRKGTAFRSVGCKTSGEAHVSL